MIGRRLVFIGLLVAVPTAHAGDAVDHSKTRFPLTGRHEKVACESCHPASGGTRKWAGVPLLCSGCHSDRKSHKGTLGAQCQSCHDPVGWKSVKHPAAAHRLALSGKHALQCASCHAQGKHLTATTTCGDCHERRHGGTRATCTTCHTVESWKTVAFKQHTYDPALLPGKHRAATCLGCHPAFRFKGTTTQCESCHKQPHEDLGACKRCHTPLSWKDVDPTHQLAGAKPVEPPTPEHPTERPTPEPPKTPVAASSGEFRVTAKFNHAAHAAQVIARGMKPTCASCHAGGDGKKRPAMQACESCHDGKGAFDALGTQCDRCHQAPPGAPTAVLPLPPTTFQHAAHAKRKVKIDDCVSCHAPAVEWDKLQAGHDQHRPCQGCHAEEFRKPGQAICLGCHVRNEPFRPNPLRPPDRARTEFRAPDAADLPHAPHIAARVACETCHPAEFGMAPRAPSAGHAVCGKCHRENGEGGKLTLARCAACHVPASRAEPRTQGRWSTRDRFRHDKDHRAQTCAECHLAGGARDLTAPTMQGCAACHDGRKAFKTIDKRGCVRCHDH